MADNAPEKERDDGDFKWFLLILTYFRLELLADHGPEYANKGTSPQRRSGETGAGCDRQPRQDKVQDKGLDFPAG